ncbi:hypothetical protein BGZ74_007057 [Mortierella antarctica]|nr:hypothetical protein BGZ74_007057 [Mortierella antarctica]
MAPDMLEHKLAAFLPSNLSVDALYASLKHGCHQSPVAWSCKNVAIVPSWVPDKKDSGLMNPSFRMLSLLLGGGKARLWDTCMEDISMVHLQNNITHVLWSHSGNFFTSMDDKGKIVIWANKRYLNAWLPVYMVVLDNPIVCCEWVNPDRTYVTSKIDGVTKYERERTGRPRGPLALVILTSDGQLTSIFKPAGQYFTHITTHLPRRPGGENLTSSRISHGSMMSDADGIHLATHMSDILPLAVSFYKIDLQFSPDVIFHCDPMAILHVSNPLTGQGSIMTPSIVHQLLLLPQTLSRPRSIAVAVGSREESDAGSIQYTSQVMLWDITPKVIGFHPAFQELSTRRNDAVAGQPSLTFVMVGERQFRNKFVTSLARVPRSRELVVGFSDGTVLGLESRFSGLLDATSTLLDGFKGDKGESAIVALQPSPNGLSLFTSSLNGHIDVIFTSDSTGFDIDLDSLVQSAVLALLNEWDYSDIISIVVRALEASSDQDLADRFMENIFRSYESITGAEDGSMIEPFMPRSSVMRRMLSLQLVLFQAIPQKTVQYRATNALMHLQSIGEIFVGCCTSDPAILAAHLDASPSGTPPQQLAFDIDSLWSLFPLSGWVLDFCTVLFKELTIFLNMKTAGSGSGSGSGPGSQPQSVPDGQASPQSKDQHTPLSTSTPTSAPTSTLLSFLYHSRARKSLRSVLILVEQFHQYVRIRAELYMRVVQTGGAIEASANPGANNHTNSMSLPEAVAVKEIHLTILSQYVQATYTRCPVKVEVAKSMLRDLNGLNGPVATPVGGAVTNGTAALNGALDTSPADHTILIKGVIPTPGNTSIAQAKTALRNITRRYPTLWDTNRLMFATIHWLDLEPACPLVKVKSGSKQRVSAIHPSRCRIDPAVALRTRPSNANTSIFAGRLPPGLQQYGSSLGNISMGSRGSISGGAGRQNSITRIFTESPGELPVSQQATQQLHHPTPTTRGFSDGSTMAAVGSLSGAMSRGFDKEHYDSIWGMACESDEDDNGEESDQIHALEDDEAEYLRPIWQHWNQSLQGQAKRSLSHHGAGMVPDDDVMEDEGDEESDEEISQRGGQRSRRNRKSSQAVQSRRSSLATASSSSSPHVSAWLVQESRTASQRTRVEWTVFPVLNEERDNAVLAGADSSRMGVLGLKGHFAPAGFQSPVSATEMDVLVHSYQTQAAIEAQVRKRRFGTDMVRKVKKYKTSGLGRQCIRCLQVATTNSNTGRGARRALPLQVHSQPGIIPDIAASTLWYHNYDRSCICGGMWLEL